MIKQGQVAKSDQVVLIPDIQIQKPKAQEQAEEPSEPQISFEELYEQTVSEARQEAERVSKEILKLAHSEHDVLIKQAEEDAERIRAEAYREGLERGRQEKREELRTAIENTNRAIQQIELENVQYMHLYEEELKNLAVDVASRILRKRITPDGHELAELVKAAINSVKDADWITVELSERMPGLLSFLESELKESRTNAEIVAKDLPEDTCIVKTSDGNIDASVTTQLRNVKEYFDQV
ncbi:FliH/SctL family protein [Marasmitruncus massiliensis]|uniref:FliH/SctL family protein n=1 Tax=Marasmitruncus massiliensis TaxID=1944642 RepID=UPI001FA8C97E|nr:FliH/SctL family protein [Marasmitruncus massiliensis]